MNPGAGMAQRPRPSHIFVRRHNFRHSSLSSDRIYCGQDVMDEVLREAHARRIVLAVVPNNWLWLRRSWSRSGSRRPLLRLRLRSRGPVRLRARWLRRNLNCRRRLWSRCRVCLDRRHGRLLCFRQLFRLPAHAIRLTGEKRSSVVQVRQTGNKRSQPRSLQRCGRVRIPLFDPRCHPPIPIRRRARTVQPYELTGNTTRKMRDVSKIPVAKIVPAIAVNRERRPVEIAIHSR